MALAVTPKAIREIVQRLDLDEFDEQDAMELMELMLSHHTTVETATWMLMPDEKLGTTPLKLVQEGKTREVLLRAREMLDG